MTRDAIKDGPEMAVRERLLTAAKNVPGRKILPDRGRGKVNPANGAMTTPMTTATFFKADKVIPINKPMSYQELQQDLNGQLPTQNIFYAIRVNGTFDSIKARNLTKLNKPYQSNSVNKMS